MLEYYFDRLEWKISACWSILAKNHIISLKNVVSWLDYFLWQIYSTVHTVLYMQYCCNITVATVLLQQYCCNSTVATLLFQQYCCNSTVATALLQQYCCNSAVATILYKQYCIFSSVYFHIKSNPVMKLHFLNEIM